MHNKENGSVYLASTESELEKGWLKCGINSNSRISFFIFYSPIGVCGIIPTIL